MRIAQTLSASLFFALTACGQAAAPSSADAQPAAQAGTPATGEVSAAERTAILRALSATPDASGQVENECGDRVTPQLLPVDLGAGVGRAVAYIIGGGPSAAACYGDGPLIVVLRNNNGAWSQIYMRRGGMMIILPATHNGANDVADGGPGFSFPVRQWNGTTYVGTNREVADSALNDARFLP